jgi:hypothetical protein
MNVRTGRYRERAERGQAFAEVAIMASLMLLVFGVLIAYIQRFNDQQYAQMTAFRNALRQASVYGTDEGSGAGASIQYTLIENRRHADVSSGFQKRSPQTFSASANVFWAIPETNSNATSLIGYKINEEEFIKDYDTLSSKAGEGENFQTGQIITSSDVEFNETMEKTETPQQIRTVQNSRLEETVTTVIPYEIVTNDTAEDVVSSGTLISVTQGLYRDADGQYKYHSDSVGTVVERGRSWTTSF